MEGNQTEALQFLTNRYVDNVWKHVGIHLLAAGWILSSAQLHALLTKSVGVQIGLTIIFLLLELVHLIINVPIYKLIKKLEGRVEADSDISPVEVYGVNRRRFIWNEVMIGSIAVFALAFVWASPHL